MKGSTDRDPHDPCGQPSAARRFARDGRRANGGPARGLGRVRRSAPGGGRRHRAPAGAARGRRDRRRRDEQAELHHLRERAPRGLRAQSRCAGGAAAGPGRARCSHSPSSTTGSAARCRAPARRPRTAPAPARSATRATRAAGRHRQSARPRSTARAPPRRSSPPISPSNIEHWHRTHTTRRGGVSLRDRRGDARGVPGDRRRGLPAADRRPAAGDLLHRSSRA